MAGLHSAFMAKAVTPGHIFSELTIARNAPTTSGVDVFTGNKARADLVLPATTTQGGKTCETCNGRGAIGTTAHNTSGRHP